jgi:hypothetical protein
MSRKLGAVISDELHVQLGELQKSLGLNNQADVLEVLYNSYVFNETNKPNLSPEESNLVNQAVEVSGFSYQDILTRGLVAESKGLISIAEKTANLKHLTTAELKHATYRGVASERIGRALKAVMDHNDGCAEIEDRWYISKTMLRNWLNANYRAMNEFWDGHAEEIAAHNEKHGLDESHGLKHNRGKDIRASVPY